MKPHKDLIKHFEVNASKSIGSHGIGSDYARYAMFCLNACIAGVTEIAEIHAYAEKQMDAFKEFTLDQV